MTRLETIERQIKELPSSEFDKLRDWFIEFDARQWSRQIEEDVATGRLDALADAALEQLRAGNCSKL